MAHYISTLAYMEERTPVFESISELDGRLIAWDEKVFSSLLGVAQRGKHVFIANCPDDLSVIGRQIIDVGPSVCLFERRFFESHFKQRAYSPEESVIDG